MPDVILNEDADDEQQAAVESYFDDDDGRYDAELDALLEEMRVQRPTRRPQAPSPDGDHQERDHQERDHQELHRTGAGERARERAWPAITPTRARSTPDALHDRFGDAAFDVEMRAPTAFRRDRGGRWRYVASGRVVPGAHDVTLGNLHAFRRHGEVVEVPIDQAQSDPDLAWCLDFRDTLAISQSERRARMVIAVPAVAWDERARIPITLYAPELAPDRLLDVAAVAALVGIDRSTVAAYLARGQMPEPVARVGNSPVWSRPVIQHWLDHRPGPGVGGGPRRRRSR